jgi:hypothetical protein
MLIYLLATVHILQIIGGNGLCIMDLDAAFDNFNYDLLLTVLENRFGVISEAN